MRTALTMPEVQRRDRCAAMFHHVMTHSSSAWARSFLTALLTASNLPLTWLKDLGESPAEESGSPPDVWHPSHAKAIPPAAVTPVAMKASELPPSSMLAGTVKQ